MVGIVVDRNLISVSTYYERNLTMKAFVSFLSMTPVLTLASSHDLTLYNAQRYGAEFKFVLRVIDNDGFPVAVLIKCPDRKKAKTVENGKRQP